MKLFGAIKFWMPLVGLGAALVLAPQSRAQADVSPDHFDENGITSDFAHTKPLAAKTAAKKTAAAPTASNVAHNQKPRTKAKAQTVAKNSPAAPKDQLVAVNDKSKLPPRKQNDPK
jgi:hypothetical protein